MGYLTINTRSNRVVIISSVIRRIFELRAIPGWSHFNLFNKDISDLFILCILCLCQLSFCNLLCSLLIVVVHLFRSLLDSHLFLIQLLFHCSLFKRKRFNSDPGLCSRYFDPAYHHHLCKSINIIHQTSTLS
jgi:hypothetical protein